MKEPIVFAKNRDIVEVEETSAPPHRNWVRAQRGAGPFKIYGVYEPDNGPTQLSILLCWKTLPGFFVAPADADSRPAPPIDAASAWTFCGTADSVLECPCPTP